MAKAVAHPIPLKVGRWSLHPWSRGNFVFSFEGHIPFDTISSYEHILLNPFQGSGQLRPSLGWTRMIAHGVPFMEFDGKVFGPDALLMETCTLPGLKKAFFAMEPRWLRPVGQILSLYSSITFAFSDPDGAILSALLKGRPAIFGKEVRIQKWIERPLLVQCSRCHALGHNKASKACPLSHDSAKCYICGNAHRLDEHNQRCPSKHAVVGICDCTNYKCINCLKPGHNCRDESCPARDQYRPRNRKAAGRPKDKGKQQDPAEGPGLPRSMGAAEEVGLTGNEPPAAQDDGSCPSDQLNVPPPMDVDGEQPSGQAPIFSESPQSPYSPSRPQTGAASDPFA
jgi:hypothetical protein